MARARDAKVRRGGALPALCNALGTFLIVLVFALTLPLVAPRALGYEVFDVVSGSMEPELPRGSVIYVRAVEAAEVQVDEVIAFEHNGSVVAHRVVSNRTSLGEFVTKGDANNVEDLEPVPYDALIGTVAMCVPLLGQAMALYASTLGKVYLALTLACGAMLNIVADRMREDRGLSRKRKKGKAAEGKGDSKEPAEAVATADAADATAAAPAVAASAEAPAESGPATSAPAAPAKTSKTAAPRRGSWVRNAIAGILLVIFVGSGSVVGYVTYHRHKSDEIYTTATERFERMPSEDDAKRTPVPIQIDFASLCAENEDVVGWLYCPDTPINYPVLHGESNDQYLRHDYTGEYNINGSIFVDAENEDAFADANTIVYGHHMDHGAMFATLEEWGEQSYYEQHPVMWLLTPTQDYQVVLVSGHHTSAYSNMYDIIHEPGEEMNAYLADAVEQSDFVPIDGVQVNPRNHYVMLTTCAYIFDNARYVLHGMLVPVNSAGGVPGAQAS